MLEVRLFPGLPGGRWARVGPITGLVEESVEPEDPEGFAILLDSLLLECVGTTVGPGRARDLAVCDNDRIAAEIYLREYGNRVESEVRCGRCGKDFKVSFPLVPLIPRSEIIARGVEGPDDLGAFKLRNGPRFRLPTLRDQLAVLKLDADSARRELFRHCVNRDLDQEEEIAALEEAMERVGPLISGPITMDCPHCKLIERDVEFSMQRFLLEALAFEKRFLHYEVHYLARAYGWNRGDVLALSKSDRRLYVGMVLAEKASR
jgi:hypothetical protein